MATGTIPVNPNEGATGPLSLGLGAQNYTSLGSLLDPTKEDVRELYVETFGDQGLTGFLDLTGAVRNAGTSDEVQWYEEGRLHRTINCQVGDISAGATGTYTIVSTNGDSDLVDGATGQVANIIRVNDVLLNGATRVIVTDISTTAGTLTFTGLALTAQAAISATAGAEFAVIGNMYAQGTGQPGKFYQSSLTKRRNSYIITKDTFHVNGSQATNIGWLKVGGQYRWYVKGEMDSRKRFMNQREAMMLYANGSSTAASSLTVDGTEFNQSEGYFAAVSNRGITTTGFTDDSTTNPVLSDLDAVILNLDKEGAVNEYAMYLNRELSLNIDDMIAAGVGTGGSITAGLASQFGAFQNSEDMAVKLGFKSFQRGGYTFHKHDWKILNDPTMGALGDVKGAMVPMTQVADAQTGVKAPSLEMNYKAANGYSRDIEHWVEGGGVLGFNTNDQDVAKFHYRSECNLVTRAANQHVLLK